MEDMYVGYINAVLRAETPLDEESDRSLESLGFDAGDFAPKAMQSLRLDCALFYHLVQGCGIEFPRDLKQVGIDLYLTRQHLGAGFRDRPELYGEKQAERLTKLVHANFGEFATWIDDAGHIQIEKG